MAGKESQGHLEYPGVKSGLVCERVAKQVGEQGTAKERRLNEIYGDN